MIKKILFKSVIKGDNGVRLFAIDITGHVKKY